MCGQAAFWGFTSCIANKLQLRGPSAFIDDPTVYMFYLVHYGVLVVDKVAGLSVMNVKMHGVAFSWRQECTFSLLWGPRGLNTAERP